MRFPFILAIAVTCFGTSALAQSQQAGNEASANAADTFQQLIDKCDDTDALVLRARIRLAMGRLDDQAAIDDLTDRTNQGLSLCGEGKVDEAKAQLTETLAAADAKVSEKFGQDATAEVKAAATQPKGSAPGEPQGNAAKAEKPWWQFW